MRTRDDIGPMVAFGAIGAGVGIGIDALLQRRTIFDITRGPIRLQAAPLIRGDGPALQFSLSF